MILFFPRTALPASLARVSLTNSVAWWEKVVKFFARFVINASWKKKVVHHLPLSIYLQSQEIQQPVQDVKERYKTNMENSIYFKDTFPTKMWIILGVWGWEDGNKKQMVPQAVLYVSPVFSHSGFLISYGRTKHGDLLQNLLRQGIFYGRKK